MLTELITIATLTLLTAMLPGPDFALVTKNTILFSRRAGILTTLGISCALMIHVTYCSLGLALIIANSIIAFNIIKYLGAAYLLYLGIITLQLKNIKLKKPAADTSNRTLKDFTAFKQGFLCNLLNPKATMFFLALFTMVVKPGATGLIDLCYAIVIFATAFIWFSSLTYILSHRRVMSALNHSEIYISKLLGIFLIGFGITLIFMHK